MTDGQVGEDLIGTLKCFRRTKAPYGYLHCDGTTYNITKYPKLYSILGTDTLPDYRDKFIMGSGTNAVGTVKTAGLPNITDDLGKITTRVQVATGNANERGTLFWTDTLDYYNAFSQYGNSDWCIGNLHFNASKANSIYGNSTTVQPPAVCALICIKAL